MMPAERDSNKVVHSKKGAILLIAILQERQVLHVQAPAAFCFRKRDDKKEIFE
jgi:hypothetical protein